LAPPKPVYEAPVEVRARFEIEAEKRGITINGLFATIPQVAAEDGIIGAVLDG